MARSDETIVEEWLNRRGYFTIRSLKKGRTECDLLAVPLQNSDAVHVEVNISPRPSGWIGKKDLSGKKLPGGKNRTKEQVEEGITDFVNRKYRNDNAAELRERLWPEQDNWRFMYVYGKLKHPKELRCLKREHVEVRNVVRILKELESGKGLSFETDSDAAHFIDLYELRRR